MATAKWSERPETETDLPTIPWLITPPVMSLSAPPVKSLSAFLAPLDNATEFYLMVLWNNQVSRALAQSQANQASRELASSLRTLDWATETYLENYWNTLKMECIANSTST